MLTFRLPFAFRFHVSQSTPMYHISTPPESLKSSIPALSGVAQGDLRNKLSLLGAALEFLSCREVL